MRWLSFAAVGAALALLLPVLAAIGFLSMGLARTVLGADAYDKTCAVDSDCELIIVGDVCACACQFAAVSKSGKARYDVDRAAISCTNDKICGPCQAQAVACSAGRCALK